MAADLLIDERFVLSETAFAEIVVWRLPRPAHGSAHRFKYRLALVEHGVCVLRYDNEAGKDDHRRLGRVEEDYRFKNPEALLADFWNDVNTRRRK
jgi:uncharacterized protein DUF6516